MAKAYIEHEGKRIYPEELLAFASGVEFGVVLNNDGSVTNRWEDGTIGVPTWVQEELDCDGAHAYAPEEPWNLKEVSWEH